MGLPGEFKKDEAPVDRADGFKCLRCGDCCRWSGYVYITENDVNRISTFLNLSKFDFVNEYAEMRERPRLSLKMQDGRRCIFLKGSDCSIHPVKPRQCAGFPDVWRIKEFESLCNGYKKFMQKNIRRT